MLLALGFGMGGAGVEGRHSSVSGLRLLLSEQGAPGMEAGHDRTAPEAGQVPRPGERDDGDVSGAELLEAVAHGGRMGMTWQSRQVPVEDQHHGAAPVIL